MGEGEDVGRRLLSQKPLPNPPENRSLVGRFSAGCMKKRVNLRNSSKLDSLIFTLFFCPLCGRDHALRDRPAVIVGWLRQRGSAVFPVGKTSGFSRRSGVALPTRFAAAKRRPPSHKPAERQSGRQRRPSLLQQTEKGAWEPSASLLADRIPNPFSYRLPRLNRSQ